LITIDAKKTFLKDYIFGGFFFFSFYFKKKEKEEEEEEGIHLFKRESQYLLL